MFAPLTVHSHCEKKHPFFGGEHLSLVNHINFCQLHLAHGIIPTLNLLNRLGLNCWEEISKGNLQQISLPLLMLLK